MKVAKELAEKYLKSAWLSFPSGQGTEIVSTCTPRDMKGMAFSKAKSELESLRPINEGDVQIWQETPTVIIKVGREKYRARLKKSGAETTSDGARISLVREL